jgi:hypothetical protein
MVAKSKFFSTKSEIISGQKTSARTAKEARAAVDASTPPQNIYAALSLRDLLDARDQYHVHLMVHPKVIATAIGYYRIRKGDSAPA